MKKILSLLLCLMLLPCAAVAAEARTPLTWLSVGDTAAEAIQKDDRIIQYLSDKFNIDLDVQFAPEANVQKVNIAMASGDFPDIVTGVYGNSATQSWIDNGLVIPLNPYFDQNPNLAQWFVKYVWSDTDGQYYGMPFMQQYSAANALICMRQDWLDNLNLTYPKTLDEMKKVLMAFTYDDPDGDKQNNTYGFTTIKPVGKFDWVFFAYGRKNGDYELDENGNIIPWFESPCFIPGMTYIKELWDAGVIDPEFLLNTSNKQEEKFYQGKAGAAVFFLYRNLGRIEGNLQQMSPGNTLAYGLPPVGPDGESFGLSSQGRDGKYTCITTACKTPDKAAALLDYLVSPEGVDLVRLGIEGIHYTKENGVIHYNEEERAKDAFSANGWCHALAWFALYAPLDSNYMPETEPTAARARETVELATMAQKKSLIVRKTAIETEYGSALGDIYNQYFIDMLQGKIGIEEGAQQLSKEWRSQGGEEMLESLNATYQASLKK